MPIDLIAQPDIRDRATCTKDASAVMDIFNRYGGELLSVAEVPEVLEGEWSCTGTVLLGFPSREQAREWYESEDDQAIARHKRAASVANVVLIRAR